MIESVFIDRIREYINKYQKEVIELNDYLADNPEISGKEFNSVKKIAELLSSKGLEIISPVAGLETAFITSINKNKAKKAAILVEYDALPGVGHGCGHCASGAISVLAGLVLSELRDSIDGQIDIIGTPDEEALGGKIAMAENGLFDDYDFAIMIHMNNINTVRSNFLALDGLEINFKGKASHASASPWEGRNALNAAQLLFHAIDMMRQHVKPDVRIHGYIKEGGKAPNVVPDFASAEFYTRSIDRGYLDEITEWVKDCAKGAALSTRTKVEMRYMFSSLKDLAKNATAEELLTQIYEDLGIPLVDLGDQAFGSSDIGHVDYVCPAFHPTISINEPFALHTEEFSHAMKSSKTHESIVKGAEIISRFVINLLNDENLLNNAKSDYKKFRK